MNSYIQNCYQIKKMKRFILLSLVFMSLNIQAQTPLQNIRGSVVDKETAMPIEGVNVYLVDDTIGLWADITDANGEFRIEDVTVGKHNIAFSFIGYEDLVLNKVELTTAKELILNVELDEQIVKLDEVKIVIAKEGATTNEMAPVSARQFSVEETNRYAGSRGDPARMASNFAGVLGADDSRNDLVIRGNSPAGVLYQIEGINIPNPNHFAIAGTAGGPLSMINNKYLANSEFYTGAFPAEFGNSIAGVFGLKLRNGNEENYEHSVEFGLFGAELFSEGPINKEKKSSYIVGYKYATFEIFDALNIDLGTEAIPYFQDMHFKLNFPLKGHANISFWGMGGLSSIDILISEQVEVQREVYGESDRDQLFRTNSGVVGMTYLKPLKNNSYLKTSLAGSLMNQNTRHYFVFRRINATDSTYILDSLAQLQGYDFKEWKISSNTFINRKVNAKNSIKYGVNLDYYIFNFQDTFRNVSRPANPNYYDWIPRWSSMSSSLLAQPYYMWKHRFTDKFSMNLGLHSQYWTLNNSVSIIEPRGGVTWTPNDENSFSFGAGLHSQLIPTYVFFYSNNYDTVNDILADPHNLDLDFMRSWHFVGGYEHYFHPKLRLKAEVYYQYLFNIPVERDPSSFSLLNAGSGFTRFFPDSLVNEGTGQNYGIEMTLEKFLAKNYLFMITGSYFEALYTGSDGVERDTDFNGNYAFNALVNKTFPIKAWNGSVSIGGKVTYAGGKLYGPVDSVASVAQEELVFIDSLRNTLRFEDYFRADVKIALKINQKKVTHEFAIDLVNVSSRENVLGLTYTPNQVTNTYFRKEYQLGFLPIFYYKIDF